MANENNPFGDLTQIMGQFKLPGVDMGALIEARRKDIEALVEANKAAMASMQALGTRQVEMFKDAMQGIQESSKAVVDPAKQAEVVRKACDKAIADMQELAEMARQSQADSMAHITRRATEQVDEIKQLLTPK